MKTKNQLLLMAAVGLLAACGGHDDNETPAAADNKVPASAAASSRAWTQYALAQPLSETAQPLDVSDVTPPTSETDPAQAL